MTQIKDLLTCIEILVKAEPYKNQLNDFAYNLYKDRTDNLEKEYNMYYSYEYFEVRSMTTIEIFYDKCFINSHDEQCSFIVDLSTIKTL